MTPPLITLLTDFGLQDPFVGIMKGVILSIHPQASIVDLTHGVPPQNVLAGALILRHSVRFFPEGTVHVAVVDPGVGTGRRSLLIETQRCFLIGPDNGLLSLAAPAEEKVRIFQLTNPRFFLSPTSHTFHGRDVFAPVAAHLSLGRTPSEFGPEIPEMERIQLPAVRREKNRLLGQVIYIDHFGNLITNICEADLVPFPKGRLSVSIRKTEIPRLSLAYADVQEGELLALVNSWGYLEVAVRGGSAARFLGCSVGEPILVSVLEEGHAFA